MSSSTVEGQNQTAVPRIQALRQRAHQLVDTVHTLQRHCDELGHQDAAWHSQQQALHDQIATLTHERDQLKSERDALAASQQALNSERASLQAERNALQEQRDALQTERDGLQVERNDLNSRMLTLTSECQELTSQRQDLSGQLEALSAQCDGLRQERDQLTSERNALATSQQELKSQRESLQDEANRLETDKQLLRAALEHAFPYEAYRKELPDLSRHNNDELIDHFLHNRIKQDIDLWRKPTKDQPEWHSKANGILSYDWNELALQTDGREWSRGVTTTRELYESILQPPPTTQGYCLYKSHTPSDLCRLFDYHGSDKGSNAFDGVHSYQHQPHSYGQLYELIFAGLRNAKVNILECGVGTTDTDTPSNMGPHGRPGASLRAWRDYFPSASIYGFDVDPGCLFQEQRIATRQADQLDPQSVRAMWDQWGNPAFDVIIDDGLHTADAALSLLNTARNFMANGGIYVIEDMTPTDLTKIDKALVSLRLNYYLFSYLRTREIAYSPRIDDNNLIVIAVPPAI